MEAIVTDALDVSSSLGTYNRNHAWKIWDTDYPGNLVACDWLDNHSSFFTHHDFKDVPAPPPNTDLFRSISDNA